MMYPTAKLEQAKQHIVNIATRLMLQDPFPVDPMKFYLDCMPPHLLQWADAKDTRTLNLTQMFGKSRLVHFTDMDTDDYEIAVASESLTYYSDVFWLMMPEPVITWGEDTCDAFNIPSDHFAYDKVRAWRQRQVLHSEFLNTLDNKLDELATDIHTLKELVTAFPALEPFCGTKVSNAVVSKKRQVELTRRRQKLFTDAEAAHLIEQLSTGVLLPEIDVDSMPFGLNWR